MFTKKILIYMLLVVNLLLTGCGTKVYNSFMGTDDNEVFAYVNTNYYKSVGEKVDDFSLKVRRYTGREAIVFLHEDLLYSDAGKERKEFSTLTITTVAKAFENNGFHVIKEDVQTYLRNSGSDYLDGAKVAAAVRVWYHFDGKMIHFQIQAIDWKDHTEIAKLAWQEFVSTDIVEYFLEVKDYGMTPSVYTEYN